MKKQLTSLAILASASLASVSLQAAESPEWNYAEASIESLSIEDSGALDPYGFGLSASYLLSDNIFIDGSYNRLQDDVADIDWDLTQFDLNIGYRFGVTNTTDVYASIGYLSLDVEVDSRFGSGGGNDDGQSFKVGTRSRLTDQFEIDIFAAHESYSDFSDNQFGLSGHYYLNDNFAIGAAIKTNGDDEQTSLSIRYAF
ncbi:porin family protein [Glaciecola sp.]|jgi:hypothetical protein|uniref:porin family protein n=1 Tax=Glaciecola sp. MF2-115 TaxID=3384827 RepID=UPI003988F061